VARPVLEVADIFRAHGPAWREANAGHVSLGQLKVMSAIENCRTAALGGHVMRCEDCAHEDIAYNSCRNRHCPKCQGAAARAWLAEREAELLPVPYYHLVFTLPAAVADIAYHNKATVYDLLFKASSEALMTIATDPKHLGARVGAISVLHTWGSALTHHPHVHMIAPGGGLSLDGLHWVACRPGFFLPVRVLSRLFRRLFLEKLLAAFDADQLQFLGAQSDLAARDAFTAFLAPLHKAEWVVYAKRPFGGPRGRAGLSSPLHPSRRHRQQPADHAARRRRHVQMEGLPDQGPRSPKDNDASRLRVHPPLPHSRPAERLPSHSPLRSVRQRRSRGKHRTRASLARVARAVRFKQRCRQLPGRRSARLIASMPMLRRPHDRHRDVRRGRHSAPCIS